MLNRSWGRYGGMEGGREGGGEGGHDSEWVVGKGKKGEGRMGYRGRDAGGGEGGGGEAGGGGGRADEEGEPVGLAEYGLGGVEGGETEVLVLVDGVEARLGVHVGHAGGRFGPHLQRVQDLGGGREGGREGREGRDG